MNLKGKTINFLGDSITEGHGCSGEEHFFTTLIGERYGAVCRNYGIGGTRLARQFRTSENPRHDLDFPSRVEEMDPDADIIVVFGGTNDFGHGDAPMGDFSDRTKDTFCGALHELYRSLMEKYPGKVIVVLTPLHRATEDNPKGDGSKAAEGHVLRDYVERIRQAAEYYSLPVLDLFAVSGMQPAVEIIREKFMPDGLHPNDAGHALLADRIGAFLEAL